MFQDRTEAGHRLADRLQREGVPADIVLGIPRGALPVARPVADALGVPLDIVVASKIGAPHNPELAIGAAASDGSVYLNDDLLDRLSVPDDYLERERAEESRNARQKAAKYRGDRDPPDLVGKAVVVVDDGLATGATARACLRQVHAAGAEHVTLAVPVGPPERLDEVRSEADRVVAVEAPPQFRAVGQFYREFDQVTDEQAMAYLDQKRSPSK